MERPKFNVAVLPAGAWGTAFSLVAAVRHNVSLYFRSEEDFRTFNETHQYPRRHPGIVFPENIKAVDSIEEVLAGANIVVLAYPSKYLRESFREIWPYIPSEATILCLTKGLEQGTNLRMSEVLEEVESGISNRLAILSGPNLAYYVARGLPAGATVSSGDYSLAERMQRDFNTSFFRIYRTRDLLGVELGSAFKNVYAFAVGVSDGLGLGENARGILIPRGLWEATRLAVALGAKAVTLNGLSGMGDMIVTCTSLYSRNHEAGVKFAEGARPDELLNSPKTIEALYTVRAMVALADAHGIEVPIAQAVHDVLYSGLTIKDAMQRLIARDLKDENGYSL